jgi:hypothetical protein
MKLKQRLDVLEQLMKIWIDAKQSGALSEGRRLTVYSALNDLTGDLMTDYPNWFNESKEVEELKDTVEGLMEEISVAEDEMELHGHRL